MISAHQKTQLTFNEYQKLAHETAVYPPQHSLEYLVLGLCGEAGEVANKVKKALRGDISLLAQTTLILEECGDVQWYLSEIVRLLGFKLETCASRNLSKLSNRREHNMLKGSGDNR